MNRRLVCLVALASVLTGCTAVGPRFDEKTEPSVSDGKALIYVYRLDVMTMGARTATIAIDGKKVGGLNKGGYLVVKLNPGTYVMTQNWEQWIGDLGIFDKPLSVELILAPGDVIYRRLATGVYSWSMQDVSASTAKSELQLLNRVKIDSPFSDR